MEIDEEKLHGDIYTREGAAQQKVDDERDFGFVFSSWGRRITNVQLASTLQLTNPLNNWSRRSRHHLELHTKLATHS
jgi:hypothetical protein